MIYVCEVWEAENGEFVEIWKCVWYNLKRKIRKEDSGMTKLFLDSSMNMCKGLIVREDYDNDENESCDDEEDDDC